MSKKSKDGEQQSDKHYVVGRGRPPMHTRWKPNQSGNPAGRRRGSLNRKTMRAIAAAVLIDGTVKIKERGKEREVSKFEGLLRTIANMGLQGDCRAIKTVLDLAERWCDEEPPGSAQVGTSDSDTEILQRFGLSVAGEFEGENQIDDEGDSGDAELREEDGND